MIAVLVNSQEVLEANLLRSPEVRSGEVDVFRIDNALSASTGYNHYLQTQNRMNGYCVFVHQDVFLPDKWMGHLRDQVEQIEQIDPDWGVIGIWGVCKNGEYCGRVWCTAGNTEYRGTVKPTAEVESVDEIVIVLNLKHGIRFDEELRGFHLYATDIIRETKLLGLKSYAIDAPVVHNSRTSPQVFDKAFFDAYSFMQKKWADQLPLSTCVVPVTKFGWPLYRGWLRREWQRRLGAAPSHGRHPNPEILSRELGYDLLYSK